ncbi:MAG: MBL fold metallo-hydrolase [Chloroflexi bacterium]|nr:MBL fold metallo-hydrolase [Chloroflexota bacterium]
MRQAVAPPTQPIPHGAFATDIPTTTLFWLGGSGFMLNARGTVLLVDPAIATDPERPDRCETGHRLLVALPIEAAAVPRADAILYTRAYADHLAARSARLLARTGALYVGPPPCLTRLAAIVDHAVSMRLARADEPISIRNVRVTPTPADHPWQLLDHGRWGAPWETDDCVGFRFETPDGTIWYPGDTRLLDAHLTARDIDVHLLDASADSYHLGVEAAARLANATGAPHLVPYHYGTYDAPTSIAFNGDPAQAAALIERAEQRIVHLGPGEPFLVRRTSRD